MKIQHVHLIAAARPNFTKVAPLWHAQTNTERPITIHEGTNRPVTPEMLCNAPDAALSAGHAPVRPQDRDGATAGRCLADLRQRIAQAPSARAAP